MAVRFKRKFDLSKSLVEDWFYLALERLSPLMVGRTSAVVSPGRILMHTVVKAPSGNQTELSLVLSISHRKQCLEAITGEESVAERSTRVLSRPKRRCRVGLRAIVSVGAARPETSEQMKRRTLEEVLDVFRDALVAINSGAKKPYVVSIVFRPGVNWPPGRFEFGSYLLASVGQEAMEARYVLLARKVTEFSEEACRGRWHEPLNRLATLIAVLSDQDCKLGREILPELVTETVGVPNFYPLVEFADGSKLLRFASGLQRARSGSAYGRRVDADIVPDDLGDMVDRYERLPQQQRGLIDDVLSAFQAGLELREEMPTLALSAFLTALERLVDWAGIPKADSSCPECGSARSRTQSAILDLLVAVLGIDEEGRERAAAVLSEARKVVRNPWVHRGQLAGRDFEEAPEIWVSSTVEEMPTWAKIDYLVEEVEDFLRQLLVRIFEDMA
jgi:hypothetical protein